MSRHLLLVLAVAALLVACKSLDPIGRQDTIAGDDAAGDVAPIADVNYDAADPPGDAADKGGDPADPDAPPDPDADDGAVGDAAGDDAAGADDSPGTDVPSNPIPRACKTTLRFKPAGGASSVTVPAEWNGWDRQAHAMAAGPDGYWSVDLGPGDAPAGSWAYKYCVNGCADAAGWQADPENPLVKYVGGVENSKVVLPDCGVPEFRLASAKADWAAKSVSVVAKLYAGAGGEAATPGSIAVEHRGEPLAATGFDPATQTFTVKLTGLSRGKHSLVFRASNANGDAEPLYVPVWLEEAEFSWRDAVMYFAMTDRFANGDESNDGTAKDPGSGQSCLDEGSMADWLGGDFAGLSKKVEEGWFDDLGINAIWISAANDNPDGCYKGDLGYGYSAYHAYFPLTLDTVENHFGTLEDLRDLTRAAHDRGIRVLMDFAANHVHEASPLWQQHKDWFHQTVLVCGDGNNWKDHPVDCWFQPYLPDLDFTNDDAVEAFVAAGVWWAREADLDGFRVDAVKHLDPVWGTHAFVRALRHRLAGAVEHTGVPFYMVGETFVGDWGGGDGEEKIVKAYVSPLELNGQFDFPLYWVVLDAMARGTADMGGVVDLLNASRAFYGAEAVMSNFLGNHDVPRFVSHAAGQIADKWGKGSKEQGWHDPPGLPSSPDPFARARMAFAFLMTVPGIPLVYYGDEIGMPGAGDPDNRRMMQFEGLSAEQTALREAVGKLAHARTEHVATRTGHVVKIKGDKDFLAYAAVATGDAVVVLLNRGDARTETLSLPNGVPTTIPLTDVLGGASYTATGGQITVQVPRLGSVVLAP
ncbi:MAG: hypothetical protein FJ087_13535 [Deltaproteobacteria bacterium]|nr:hypothetical protein [Deltaproteobacteria bacterium]